QWSLESIKKKTNYKLSNIEKKLCNDYAVEILGSKRYTEWLYVYTAFNQEFKEGWIPDNYFGKVVFPQINNHIGNISDIKTLTRKLLQSELLPDVAYKVNGIFYTSNFSVISIEDVEDFFSNLGYEKLYIKLDDSNQ